MNIAAIWEVRPQCVWERGGTPLNVATEAAQNPVYVCT